MSPVGVILLLFVALSIICGSAALSCYECYGSDDCTDKYATPSSHTKTCTKAGSCVKLISIMELFGVEFTVYSRFCGKDFTNKICESPKKDTSIGFVIEKTECSCNADYCNSGDGLRMSALLLHLIVSASFTKLLL